MLAHGLLAHKEQNGLQDNDASLAEIKTRGNLWGWKADGYTLYFSDIWKSTRWNAKAGAGTFCSALRRGATVIRKVCTGYRVCMWVCLFLFLMQFFFWKKRKDRDNHSNNPFLPRCPGVALAQPCSAERLPWRMGQHLTAVLTVSEEDMGSPVLSSRWVLKVIHEGADRLWRGIKKGTESSSRSKWSLYLVKIKSKRAFKLLAQK